MRPCRLLEAVSWQLGQALVARSAKFAFCAASLVMQPFIAHTGLDPPR